MVLRRVLPPLLGGRVKRPPARNVGHPTQVILHPRRPLIALLLAVPADVLLPSESQKDRIIVADAPAGLAILPLQLAVLPVLRAHRRLPPA